MGVALRLLASSAPEEAPVPLPHLPPRGRRWGPKLTARVLVPRFALGAGVFAILGLSVGLAWMRAWSGELWFQYDLSNPESQVKVGTSVGASGSLGRAGDFPQTLFLSAGPEKKIAVRIKELDIHMSVVRLMVWARAFEPVPGSEEDKEANYREVFT